jgi:hypothetical protein
MQAQISCLKTHLYEITHALHKIDLKELPLDVENKQKEKPFTASIAKEISSLTN